MSKISKCKGLYKLTLQSDGYFENLMFVRKDIDKDIECKFKLFTSIYMHFGENFLHMTNLWCLTIRNDILLTRGLLRRKYKGLMLFCVQRD